MAKPKEDFPFDTTHIKDRIKADKLYAERREEWDKRAEQDLEKLKAKRAREG